MKLLHFFSNWITSIKTFPLSYIALILITVVWFYEVAMGSTPLTTKLYTSWALVFFLSILWPLFSIHYMNSSRKKINLINYSLQFLSILIGIWYFFILPDKSSFYSLSYSSELFYFWIFPIAVLLIFLLPTRLTKKNQDGIWIIWINIIKSVLFWVLAWLLVFGWLASALASIEALFDVNLSSDRYSYFWIFSMVLLTGSFLLNYYLVATESTLLIPVSRVRKIFWCYIILPLAIIYLSIFLAYGVKILITWNWPKGVIVRLWTWYFCLWLVTYFLTYPEKMKFYTILHKILFWSMVFVWLMMSFAIYQRINQYWFTINRYFVIAWVAWILLFSLYSIFSQRTIFLSLITIATALLTVSMYGPLNAENVTLWLQYKRLSALLKEENIQLPLWANSLENLTWAKAPIIADLIDNIVRNNEENEWWDKIIVLEDLKLEDDDNWYRSKRQRIHWVLWLQEYYSIENDKKYFSYWCSMRNKWIDIWWYARIYDLSNSNHSINDNIVSVSKEMWNTIDLTNYIEDLYKKSLEDDDKNSDTIDPYIFEDWNRKIIITTAWGYKYYDSWEIKIESIWWYLLIK